VSSFVVYVYAVSPNFLDPNVAGERRCAAGHKEVVVFDDVNRTIEALLRAELPANIAEQVTISFSTPDETFPPSSLSLPAINFFLFEVHERAELREVAPSYDRSADGSVVRAPSPVRVDCHYLVVAVAAGQAGGGPEQDEARLLGATLRVLLRHRQLPAAVLRGSLAGLTPPLRALAVAQGARPSGIELWQALKGKPRASLHYTLTVPVDTSVSDVDAPVVTSTAVGAS
jgi:hypothetical protein